ncbi:MAG: divergent PAP2 family protein [Candidatus Doudnabacteria bacterium]|nr:divergent PAP2 family protein [Candidatus Doudnabacteria bacterium]
MEIFIIPLLAWALAQGGKFLSKLGKNAKFRLTDLLDYGGMPSSHAAIVASLCTLIGLRQGLNSPLFGITLIFSLFIIHDALRLRNLLQEHSKILNQLRRLLFASSSDNVPVNEKIGHTLAEVIVGLVLGVALTLAINRFF